jgi:hypothetical protein
MKTYGGVALGGGEWSPSSSATLPPEKGPLIPTGQQSGWAPELVQTWW